MSDGAGAGLMSSWNKKRYAEDAEYRARERERQRAYDQAHRAQVSASRNGRHLRRCYGLSRADYDALLKRQGGVCAICGKPSTKTLCVDHCHTTGTIRGLLCRKCNFGLGCLVDDQVALIAALVYLGSSARDGSGSAAQRALLARAALPKGRRRAVLTRIQLPFRVGARRARRWAGVRRT